MTEDGAGGRHPGAARPLVLKIGPGVRHLHHPAPAFRHDLGQGRAPRSVSGPLSRLAPLDGQWAAYRVERLPRLRHQRLGAAERLFGVFTFLGSVPTTIPSNQECAREPLQAFYLTLQSDEDGLTGGGVPVDAAGRGPGPLRLRRRQRHRAGAGEACRMTSTTPAIPATRAATGGMSSRPWQTSSTIRRCPRTRTSSTCPTPSIIINTEFGRTPFKSFVLIADAVTSIGRDHWPQAYVNVMILGGSIATGVLSGRSTTEPTKPRSRGHQLRAHRRARAAGAGGGGHQPLRVRELRHPTVSPNPFGSALTHEEAMEAFGPRSWPRAEEDGDEFEEHLRRPG